MTNKQRRVLNKVLWVVQVFLALTFFWAGGMKIFQPYSLPFPWVKDQTRLVFITGIIDLLAGAGMLLPSLLRILPRLTLGAAYGIVLLMISAIIFHVSRGETKDIGFNILVLFLAIFIAWGRQKV